MFNIKEIVYPRHIKKLLCLTCYSSVVVSE